MPVTFEELSFAVPDGWTVSAMLSAPAAKDTFRANVLFSTDRMRQGESFPTYVDRQLVELARTLKRFTLLKRTAVTVGGGAEAIQFVVSWVGNQGPVEQWITMMPRGAGVRTITATATKSGAADVREDIEKVLESLSLLPPG